ncbi:hypothetical protein BCR43DRAFT_488732 [Syncephalastrum racemosum]|uniref:Uncharacterized protein n=1 Tax=Syncephalastrum racemosum TaxID=13706 RepID=A0A1X2HJ32_SYNRA|nr:hypothetical protein BCR43DRAFT_488732 [Syncephalastrum racemosum]
MGWTPVARSTLSTAQASNLCLVISYPAWTDRRQQPFFPFQIAKYQMRLSVDITNILCLEILECIKAGRYLSPAVLFMKTLTLFRQMNGPYCLVSAFCHLFRSFVRVEAVSAPWHVRP